MTAKRQAAAFVPWPRLKSARLQARRLSLSIAAASILAKTARDRLMIEMDATYPGYGFAAHKGYSTTGHARAIEQLGPSDIHRMSYANVRRAAQAHSRSSTR